MKKKLLSALFIIVSISCYAQSKTARFPDAFKLLPSEVPDSFIVQPINEEAKTMGFTANPGFVNSDNFMSSIYKGIDKKAITHVLVALYVRSEEEGQELGVYTIEYKSKAAMETEIKKIHAENISRYFRQDNHVVIVWSDAGSFPEQVNFVADKLKARLKLEEFSPNPANDASTTTAVDSTTAQ